MDITRHAGGCCGRRHIFRMNGATTESIIALMRQNALLAEHNANKITEIVVSEENADLEQLREEIVGAGFVLVAVWDNCSGSRCYMYLHANDWRAYPNGAEVNVAPPPPAPRDPAVIVSSTYHNVLRAGRSAAGWPTRDEAAAAAPRAVRIDQRNVYASGATRWVEGV